MPSAPLSAAYSLKASGACALYLQGMRHGAHSSVMPVLQELALV
ncbi:hypothetical protein [Methylobacterium sp. J-077]|nr:hypothetical protein [Methylobacterium sp. J-077]